MVYLTQVLEEKCKLGFQVERAQTGSLLSNQAIAVYSEESSETNTTETRLADVHVQICNAYKTCKDIILSSMVLW